MNATGLFHEDYPEKRNARNTSQYLFRKVESDSWHFNFLNNANIDSISFLVEERGGYKTRKCSAQQLELNDIEKDLLNMAHSLYVRYAEKSFQIEKKSYKKYPYFD